MRPQPTPRDHRWDRSMGTSRDGAEKIQRCQLHISCANQSDPGQACQPPHIAAQTTLHQQRYSDKHLPWWFFSSLKTCNFRVGHSRSSSASNRVECLLNFAHNMILDIVLDCLHDFTHGCSKCPFLTRSWILGLENLVGATGQV